MRKFYVIPSLLFAMLILLTACKQTLKEEIEQQAIDKDISKADFEAIRLYIAGDAKYKKYQQPSALYAYIVKVVNHSKTSVSVWNPAPPIKSEPFNANIFIENSASMDGYMAGTDLKNGVYELLDNLKNHAARMQLNYINERIIPVQQNATAAANKLFILNLSKASFKSSGGKRGTSDLADVIARVLQHTDAHNLSVLVSDFVFSPGSGKNAADYLNIQRISIENDIKDKLKKENLAIAVFQMEARFSGEYFDHNNTPCPLNVERPYYIWLLGTETQISNLMAAQVIRENNAQLGHRVVFKNTGKPEVLDYKIIQSDKIGSFTKSSLKNEINDATGKEGVFAFSVALNLTGNPRGQEFFLDASRYLLSDPAYKVIPRLLSEEEKSSRSDLAGYTHIVTFQTKRLASKTLDVKIITGIPDWVATNSSDNDSAIKTDKNQQGRTFGLAYLMVGLNDGFNAYPNQEQNIISTFKIIINK